MAMFGSSTPGYGGGMFDPENPLVVPDYMGGINEALNQNAAYGQAEPKKKGIGDFLAAFAGHYGDTLTGNPVYANSQRGKQEAEQAERSKQEQKDWWYEQQRYQRENQGPDIDADIKEFQQLKEFGYVPEGMSYQEFAQMKNPGMQSPIILPRNAQQIGGGSSGPPPEAVQYLQSNPNTAAQFEQKYGPGLARKYLGGPSPQGSGGFPGY